MSRAIRWGNVPVPYTAIWTDEIAARRPTTRRETWGGRRFLMLCEGVNQPTGKPVFTVLHADRCREVVRNGLCQMCVMPLPALVVTMNQGQTDRPGNPCPLIGDGLPMCPTCAAQVAAHCPGLQRQAASGLLRLWQSPRGAWRYAPVLLGVCPEGQGGHANINALLERSREPIWTGPKLVLREFRQIPIDALPVPRAA